MRLLHHPARMSVLLLIGLVSCGDKPATQSAGSQMAATSGVTVVPAAEATTSTPAVDETTSNTALMASTTPAAATTIATTSPPPAGPTNSSVPGSTSTEDRTDQYLEQTKEIYRRVLPDGHDFVVRLSDETYATVFGLTWTAPTGSAATCLGDRAVFIGVPGQIGAWGSAWVVSPWFDQMDPAQPVGWEATMTAADTTSGPTQYILLRTGDDAREVVLSNSDGTERDRATVTNRVAMVAVVLDATGAAPGFNDLRVAVVGADRQASETIPLAPGARNAPSECGPGEAPHRPLPQAGLQPADPAAAEAEVRERYGLLVDQSINSDQKPTDLVDDNTGVADAVEQLHSGQYAEVAATARYSVDEFVFTKPDEAWFRYTIKTSLGEYADRFGIAVFNGTVWQTTRATICQDLALALAPCQPAPPPIEAPTTPEWEKAYQDWTARAQQYVGNDGCPPLSQC
ncbi:MAG: hypothetical protein JWL72_3395 [Ilumatobacteraceae bacterium]|nr:hypothetical protein [Ilumatobacteraceae bacterium]